jgi:tetratricopeptide (TPR) repeat protein
MYATPLDIRRSKSAIAGAYEALAKFYAINRKYKEAQEALDKSYAFCRDSQQMKLTGRSFWQGVIYRGMGEYQKAIDIFQQKNRARRKESLEIEKAFTFLEWGKFAEALDIARTVVEEHPDYAYAREVLGRIYKALNEKEKAREEFEACLALMREKHSPNIAIKEIKGLLDTL